MSGDTDTDTNQQKKHKEFPQQKYKMYQPGSGLMWLTHLTDIQKAIRNRTNNYFFVISIRGQPNRIIGADKTSDKLSL